MDQELPRIKNVAGLEADSGVDQCLPLLTDTIMSELSDIHCGILLLNHGSEELLDQGSSFKKVFCALDLKVKRLLHEQTMSPKLISGINTGVKLLKISAPTFDGNIINWSFFWEQFEVYIHKKETLEEVEKLAHLRDALKNGWARQVIQRYCKSRKLCRSH